MYWTLTLLPGERYSEEEYQEMLELARGVSNQDETTAVAQDYFNLDELEEHAYAGTIS